MNFLTNDRQVVARFKESKKLNKEQLRISLPQPVWSISE
jgi:hypothetical protein